MIFCIALSDLVKFNDNILKDALLVLKLTFKWVHVQSKIYLSIFSQLFLHGLINVFKIM